MILILLTILKIIGIILLVLLGLIVLLLCLLLFAPVKYRAKGAKHPAALSVSAFVSYLWPLVRVRAEYPSETILSVKILWIDLLHPKEKKSHKKKIKTRKLPQEHEEKDGHAEPKAKETAARAENNSDKQRNQSKETEQSEQKQDQNRETEQSEQKRDAKIKSEQSDQKRSTDRKADKSGHEKTAGKTAAKKKAASHSEKDTENKLAAIVTLLWQYKEMYPDVLGRVFHALKSILPRKCNIHLIFGTGSPDNTGYLYGAYCALQEYLPGTIVFEPVWMESYLDVEFELNGNIRLIHFVTAAVKIIADKRVRNFIAEIRRLYCERK
ncbi:MAG: hypothetical protein LUG61_01370 [Lachnospiraceae bacterium]|nr:hypothetical protein [Lachnospiraceae bacterium]